MQDGTLLMACGELHAKSFSDIFGRLSPTQKSPIILGNKVSLVLLISVRETCHKSVPQMDNPQILQAIS